MLPVLGGYLEAISNPVGRFATLEGVFPCRDERGDVIFTVQTFTVNFLVEWRGRRYLLKCFLDDSPAAIERARTMGALLSHIEQTPYISDYRYLDAELTASLSDGRAVRCPVVLQHLPDGNGLDELLRICCERNDPAPVRSLPSHVAGLSKWLQSNRIVHRNIKPSNIYVTRQGYPMLLSYDFADRLVGDAPQDEMWFDSDGVALSRIAMILWILACDPSLYRPMGAMEVFRVENAEKLALALLSTADAAENDPLLAIAAIVAGTSSNAPARELSDRCIERLSGVPASHGALPLALTALYSSPLVAAVTSADPDLSHYAFVGAVSEMLTRVQDASDRWFYVDDAGSEVCGPYEQAEDFSEGRAVVGFQGKFMVIDVNGRIMIPPMYEEVVWDASAGVAMVRFEENWGMFDRSGNQLIGLDFEWMSSFREELVLARKMGKYGFLDRKGRTVVPFIYDQASSFAESRAPVGIGDEEFYIDRSGNRLEDPIDD